VRVAFVHDWLTTYRGGEKVLEALLDLYPEAPVYTLFYDSAVMPEAIQSRDVRVLRRTNLFRRGRKLLLPLLPWAIESLPLQDYDLIISTSSCVAKGAVKGPKARHLCYIHSPMRYIWDQQAEYIAGVQHIPGAAAAIHALTPRLRRWDINSARRVDRFVANSSFVADRVKHLYGREAGVVHPPIELSRFSPVPQAQRRGGYLLAAGALVSYKRFDLAIAACSALGRRLIIAGSGPMESALRAQAQGLRAQVEFIISPDDQRFVALLGHADALLFPGVEDFGMIAIEAMASGTPVIALHAGGALDFIKPDVTGLFFAASNAASLAATISAFVPSRFAPDALAAYAKGYGRAAFLAQMETEIASLLKEPMP
jgi:glycosyltransferase involved in cell wall biosynthesis